MLLVIQKSEEPPENSKNQPRPLLRPSSVNFCQNFVNLSHEIVPLRYQLSISRCAVYLDMIRSWLRNEKEAIACALSSGQLFRLPDSAPYFLRQCFLSASSPEKIKIVPRIYTLLIDSKDDAACRHAERILAADFTPTGDDVLRMRQVHAVSFLFCLFFLSFSRLLLVEI
jgi:hypothetical protein